MLSRVLTSAAIVDGEPWRICQDHYKLISISLNGLVSETVGYFELAIVAKSWSMSVTHFILKAVEMNSMETNRIAYIE